MLKFPVFNFLDELTHKGYIKDTIIQMKSDMDVDIIASTDEDKVLFLRSMIEANLYTRRELNIKSVKQYGENIMFLTDNNETFKIRIVGTEELIELKKELVKG